ncbi:MAG: hypothetical protein DRP18_04575 [Candidatus Aenigmatarchaeota archaeon]|nr:MAG: hypothetical protein DRP18_04575 [Candidatus Aenigmarchaeota archaeon]
MELLIFDVGGVLRDTSEAIYEGFKRGFLQCGLDFPFQIREVWHLRGLEVYNKSSEAVKGLLAVLREKVSLWEILNRPDAKKILDSLVRKWVTEEDSEMVERIRKVYKEYFNSEEAGRKARIYPDVKPVITRLRKSGFKLAIFTNASRKTVERDLEGLGLENFSVILSEDDVKRKKPSGEGIKKVMEILKISPDKTAYIGDSCVDVHAARDAGVQAWVVLTGMGLKIHLEKEKPDMIFRNLTEIRRFLI